MKLVEGGAHIQGCKKMAIGAILKYALRAINTRSRVLMASREFYIFMSTSQKHLPGTTIGRKRGKKYCSHQLRKRGLSILWRRWQVSVTQCHWVNSKMKVTDITQGYLIPWAKCFRGCSWVRWFCTRQPNLTLCVIEELQMGRARGLCLECKCFTPTIQRCMGSTISSISNMECRRILCSSVLKWGSIVFASHGVRQVHTTIPYEWEHLLMLSCINVVGESIPNLNIIKGKQFTRWNYIKLCETRLCVVIQLKAWMTSLNVKLARKGEI